MLKSGVKDINGIEIKSGDIVEFGNDFEKKTRGFIKYERGCFGIVKEAGSFLNLRKAWLNSIRIKIIH